MSVVHTKPPRRKKDAAVLSSPPKPSDPSLKSALNHLKPIGISEDLAPVPIKLSPLQWPAASDDDEYYVLAMLR